MRFSTCSVHAIRKIESELPKINLDDEDAHKLKSFSIFLLIAVVVTFLNRLGK